MDILKHVASIVNDPPAMKHGTGMDAWLLLTKKRAQLLNDGLTRKEVDKLILDEDGYEPTWSPF